MGYCNNCGNEIPEGTKFCSYCGAPAGNQMNGRNNGVNVNEGRRQPELYRYEEPNNGVLPMIDRFGKIYGIVLFVLSLVFLLSDPPFLRIFLAVIVIAGSLVCLIRKYKLKGFTIAALVLSIISLLIGVVDAKDNGLFGTKKEKESAKTEDVEDHSYDEDISDEEAASPADTIKEPETPVMEKEREESADEMKPSEEDIETPAEPEKETEEESENSESEIADNEEENRDPNTVDPDLKAFLDSYEAFIDEYVAFLKKYNSDPGNAITMLDDYAKMMKRYMDFAEKVDKYDSDTMSTADAKYYLDVTTRCTKKLMEVQ